MVSEISQAGVYGERVFQATFNGLKTLFNIVEVRFKKNLLNYDDCVV